LDRYATLTNSNSKLVEEHQNMEKEFEKLKYESTQYEKEKNHEILQLNNDIKDLQKKLEEKGAERN
jgi:predicted RNase H-like nuclease (RuvC/YqgF family)